MIALILSRPVILFAAVTATLLACAAYGRGRGDACLAWLTAAAWALDSWQLRGKK